MAADDSLSVETRGAARQSAKSAAASVSVLGGGPAGLGAAYKLATTKKGGATLFEAGADLGGNAGSFNFEGVDCDYGSHRLHPVADPGVLDDVKALLGEDLLLRPRHGRIRLKDRWIHFPLKPVDLALRLPKPFATSLVFDMATAKYTAKKPAAETFESVLLGGLGRTMCESFYFPYVRKLWGLDPGALAPALAQRRVSGSSLPKLLRKIFGQLPGLKSPTTGKFYYPRRGFGRISDAFADAAADAGATIERRARVEGLHIENGRAVAVTVRKGDALERRESDFIWSTLPMTTLVRAAGSAAPQAVLTAASEIRYRGMILVYIALETDQFTEYDAHYFPELAVPISRLSEPKNYSATAAPAGVTVLCAELPSDPGDQYWSMSDDALGAALVGWLGATGLPVKARLRRSFARRLPFAYPVYDRGFEDKFAIIDNWLGSIDGLLSFGRQGLFAHDNTHHALAMAYGAVDCLSESGSFDRKRWAAYREVFETHVVED